MVPQVLLAVHTWSGQPYGKRGQPHCIIGLSNRLLNLTEHVVDVPGLHVVRKMPVCHFPRGARMMSSQVNPKLATKLTRCLRMIQPSNDCISRTHLPTAWWIRTSWPQSYLAFPETPPASGFGSPRRTWPLRMPKAPEAETLAASWSLEAPSNNPVRTGHSLFRKYNIKGSGTLSITARICLCVWPCAFELFLSSVYIPGCSVGNTLSSKLFVS